MRIALLYILMTVIMTVSTHAKDLPQFMIFTYGVELNEKNVKTLVDADYNTVCGPAERLDICKKYGLHLMIELPGLETATRLRNDPGVWGYQILDEPISLKQVYMAADSVKAYRAADPTHLTYVNINQKGGHWIKFCLDTIRPDFLSYDDYPWWFGGLYTYFTGEDVMYVKLEQHRDEAIAAGLPFTKWCEVNAQWVSEGFGRTPISPEENERKIRLNVYSTLTYGAKGILWFTGRLLLDAKTGKTNDQWDQVARINHELKRLGPVLFPLVSTGVFHTPPIPAGSRQVTPDHWVQPMGGNLVMGTFRGKDNVEYVMVTNKDWKNTRTATLQFRLYLQEINTIEMFDKHTGEWESLQLTEVKDTRDHEVIYDFNTIPKEMRDNINFPFPNNAPLPPEGVRFFELYHTYGPPYQEASINLGPGDGELVRVTFKEGEEIPDPRESGHGF